MIAAAIFCQHNQSSFWDAMIIRSAAALDCQTLWSEALNDGQRIGERDRAQSFPICTNSWSLSQIAIPNIVCHVTSYDIYSKYMIIGMSAIRAKVTRNGQISLPAHLRGRWRSTSVLVIDKGDYAIVRPIPADPVGVLRGSHAGPGPHSDELRATERAADATREAARNS